MWKLLIVSLWLTIFLCLASYNKCFLQLPFLSFSQSKWTSSRSPCDVKTIVIEDCLSLGDALREIDRQVRNQYLIVKSLLTSKIFRQLLDLLLENVFIGTALHILQDRYTNIERVMFLKIFCQFLMITKYSERFPKTFEEESNLSHSSNWVITVISASAAITLLEQRPCYYGTNYFHLYCTWAKSKHPHIKG